MYKFFRMIFLSVCIAITALPVLAQDAEELPGDAFFRETDSYYTTLIPDGWQLEQTKPYLTLSNAALNATVAVVTVSADDVHAAVNAAIEQVFDEPSEQVYEVGEARFDNGLWVEAIYTLRNGITVNAFAQLYTADTYTVILYTASPAIYTLLITAPDAATAINSVFEKLKLSSEMILNTTTQLDNNAVLYEYASGDQDTLIWLRPVTTASETYYVLVSMDSSLNPDHEIIFRILDRFFVTPETANYLYLGLAAVAVLVALLCGSFYLRYQNLKRDEALITELLNS